MVTKRRPDDAPRPYRFKPLPRLPKAPPPPKPGEPVSAEGKRWLAEVRRRLGDRGRPAKSLEQLAREQGIDLNSPPPDYVELASQVWRTKAEVNEFERFLRSIRESPSTKRS
jgi:hypothetical protein